VRLQNSRLDAVSIAIVEVQTWLWLEPFERVGDVEAVHDVCAVGEAGGGAGVDGAVVGAGGVGRDAEGGQGRLQVWVLDPFSAVGDCFVIES